MANVYISDPLMDAVKTVAAVKSKTSDQFIHHAVRSAVERVERELERARKPRAIRHSSSAAMDA